MRLATTLLVFCATCILMATTASDGCCERKKVGADTYTYLKTTNNIYGNCKDKCTYKKDGDNSGTSYCFAEGGKLSECLSGEPTELLTVPDPEDFTIDIHPNNFVAAVPTWGPYFAISFSLKFDDLPSEDKEVKQVMQFFSADERFEGSVLGNLIPAISIINVAGNPTLTVRMQLSDDVDDTATFPFPDIVKDKVYDVLITQKPEISNEVFFTVSVTGHSNQNELLKFAPVIYNTLGIFICNSKDGDSANAKVTNLMFNNIGKDKKIDTPSLYGVASSWTPEYAMTLSSAFDELPDQSGSLTNLMSLVGTAPGPSNFVDLYNQDANESQGDKDSSLPNINVLRDAADEKYYWCFMVKYESTETLPSSHKDCDLTNLEGSNQPVAKKEHSIVFYNTEGKTSAAVDGTKLTNYKTGLDYVNSAFTTTLNNVKVALGQKLGNKRKDPRFLGAIVGALTPAVGQLASVGVNAAINALT